MIKQKITNKLIINYKGLNCIAILNKLYTNKNVIAYDITQNNTIFKTIMFKIEWLKDYSIEEWLKLQINTDFNLKYDLSINNIIQKEK